MVSESTLTVDRQRLPFSRAGHLLIEQHRAKTQTLGLGEKTRQQSCFGFHVSTSQSIRQQSGRENHSSLHAIAKSQSGLCAKSNILVVKNLLLSTCLQAVYNGLCAVTSIET